MLDENTADAFGHVVDDFLGRMETLAQQGALSTVPRPQDSHGEDPPRPSNARTALGDERARLAATLGYGQTPLSPIGGKTLRHPGAPQAPAGQHPWLGDLGETYLYICPSCKDERARRVMVSGAEYENDQTIVGVAHWTDTKQLFNCANETLLPRIRCRMCSRAADVPWMLVNEHVYRKETTAGALAASHGQPAVRDGYGFTIWWPDGRFIYAALSELPAGRLDTGQVSLALVREIHDARTLLMWLVTHQFVDLLDAAHGGVGGPIAEGRAQAYPAETEALLREGILASKSGDVFTLLAQLQPYQHGNRALHLSAYGRLGMMPTDEETKLRYGFHQIRHAATLAAHSLIQRTHPVLVPPLKELDEDDEGSGK